MRRLIATIIATAAIAGIAWGATTVLYDRNYAQDRSEIEDLQSRYLFALDWQKPELYASTFTTDGVLVWAGGTVNGRQAIVKAIRDDQKEEQECD